MNTKIIYGIVGALVLVGFFIIGTNYGRDLRGNESFGAALVTSSAGTTNSTQKIAQIVATTPGTYVASENKYLLASLSNTDATDRVITGVDEVFSGLTTLGTSTSAFTVQAATSSDTTTLGGNTNYVINTTFATSSPFLLATSTAATFTSNSISRIWGAGTNLNIFGNGTTSANTIFKVNYLSQ